MCFRFYKVKPASESKVGRKGSKTGRRGEKGPVHGYPRKFTILHDREEESLTVNRKASRAKKRRLLTQGEFTVTKSVNKGC
ncbi:unnamed protein product [Linum trigynum]|uniref:Uncharacterized protein n=1 Tax=Linum trigynum TaxID=586398 RepID=A0AAV2E7G9_9ROSI